MILGLSGGVDSSVVAMLVHRAIGDKLTCVFVDNGLLRLNEGEQVMEMFGDKFGLNIIKVDAEERFLAALEGKSDPEEKRKTIGHVFVDVFDEESKKLENAKWLAQVLSTQTLLNQQHRKQVKHTSSNRTTTWAVCLMIWKWVLLSRFASYSKTKYVRSV
ncbi:GMP synthase [glutamine-hydrolyzing] amidotransferase / ATP pyrophosphatase subunit [Vibrio maritimus]|uniref:GMP synthase [glutamine-hydrolyzing] n=1 Tax=Vibrio maritimus TaxID=990268 RepID=A0A090SQH0_9VIBR|nr:GMP synthase [glutamine-hydrolyzing] amidotransferase / ATP pyrophosphatase subunit [Vibrio maritimus]